MKDNNYITTLPKRDLKTSSYKMSMNKKNLKKLSKSQLIKLLLKQDENGQAQNKQSLQVLNECENPIVSPPNQEESLPCKSINSYEDLIIEPPEQFRDKQKKQIPPKPTRKRPLPPPTNDPFNFDDNMFQTETQSLDKFKIITVQSRQNKKSKSFTNEFKVKILKQLDDVKEVYHMFHPERRAT